VSTEARVSILENLRLERVGVVLEPEPGNPQEVWGVLNPGSCRTPDGRLFLYPRMVAEGNYSRIGRVEVTRPRPEVGPELVRRGIALQPEADYEYDTRSHGGVEDPRITYLPRLRQYVMTYTALGRLGPRIALARSLDGVSWERLGLLEFVGDTGVDFGRYGNKDGVLFPLPINDPAGKPAYALLHRPTYLMHNEDGTIHQVLPPGIEDSRASIWISYIDADVVHDDPNQLTRVHETRFFAGPREPWERLKIGAGTPPLLTTDGWLIFYHGVAGKEPESATSSKHVCYQAGLMLLDRDDPTAILFRSGEPVLSPTGASEQDGVVQNVVFPTALDVQAHRLDVYYGAADTRVGLATAESSTLRVLQPPSAPEPP